MERKTNFFQRVLDKILEIHGYTRIYFFLTAVSLVFLYFINTEYREYVNFLLVHLAEALHLFPYSAIGIMIIIYGIILPFYLEFSNRKFSKIHKSFAIMTNGMILIFLATSNFFYFSEKNEPISLFLSIICFIQSYNVIHMVKEKTDEIDFFDRKERASRVIMWTLVLILIFLISEYVLRSHPLITLSTGFFYAEIINRISLREIKMSLGPAH